MRLAMIRTKYFPLLFLAGGILFAALFFQFYRLVFEAIDDIFEQQNATVLQHLRSAVEKSHGEFLRQTKILHLSRGVQRRFASFEKQDEQDRAAENALALRQMGLKWYAQIDDRNYRAISYLNAAGEPVALLDFHQHGSGSSANAMTASGGQESAAQDLVAAPILALSWKSGEHPATGSYVVTLSDSSQLMRTIFPVNHRKTKALIGYVAIDRQLAAVIPWNADSDKDLLIFDSQRRHIVYDSAAGASAGFKVDEKYPYFLTADFQESAADKPPSAKLERDGREYLLTRISVETPPWQFLTTVLLDPYIGEPEERGQILILASLLFIAITGFSIYALTTRVQRRSAELERASEVVLAHNQLLEQELQTAHDMQMNLMPSENPRIAGFDIVGRCRPATEVGGDFYQYFSLEDGRLIIALADVTGHGMKAAIPTMVFSGLLATQIGYTPTPQELMPRLNNSLHRVLERRTFVCVTMAELDPNAGKLRLSNGGCPYPFVFRAATQMVEEIDLSAFPLGIRAESTYPVAEIELAHGDLVVLCSDGIIEASDSSGDLFGFDRTAETIRQMGRQNASAAQLVDYMFDAVEAFSAAGPPEDDQTMVAIRVEATADIEHIMPEN